MSVGNIGLFCVRESLDTQINLERQHGQIGNIGIRKAAPKVQNQKVKKSRSGTAMGYKQRAKGQWLK